MVVRSEDLELWIDPNNLEESEGAFAALNAKANFQHRPHFFRDPIHIRRALIVKREAYGADTPIGHGCSNVIEILENLYHYERPAWATHESQTLPWLLNRQMERLARLSEARP